MPKIGDLVQQQDPPGIWWMSGPYDGDPAPYYEDEPVPPDALNGVCVWVGDRGWAVGDECPFSALDGFDEGTEVIGSASDFDHARAMAVLTHGAGFVKGDNNG